MQYVKQISTKLLDNQMPATVKRLKRFRECDAVQPATQLAQATQKEIKNQLQFGKKMCSNWSHEIWHNGI